MDAVLDRPVASTEVSGGASLVGVLEDAYGRLRAAHVDLPDVVITTGSGRVPGGIKWGHCHPELWREALGDGRRPELFIAGEALAQGAEHVLLVMLHESAHLLGVARGIRNCSGQGNRYHNAEFRKLGEEMGLWWPHDRADEVQGYSHMELSTVALAAWSELVAELAAALAFVIDTPDLDGTHVPGGDGGRVEPGPDGGDEKPPKPADRNPMKFTCECDPPRIMRMSPKTWEQGDITCSCCNALFE